MDELVAAIEGLAKAVLIAGLMNACAAPSTDTVCKKLEDISAKIEKISVVLGERR